MIKQKRGEQNCGQCCIATILDVPLEEAIWLIGHNKSTKSKELTKHLKCSGNKRGLPKENGLCILRFNKSRNWHWIVKYGDYIYDPLRGKLIPINKYFDKNPNYRVTSHFIF